jgi:hypothetical protein
LITARSECSVSALVTAAIKIKTDGYSRRVHQLSAEGFAVLTQMSPSAQRPRVLHSAFRAGRVPVGDLPELIAFAWLRDDSPTSDLGEAEWLEIYAAIGFFSYPEGRTRPSEAITLYRGASADRLNRMSWTDDRQVAVMLGTRHAWYKPAALYEATVTPDAILAFLGRQGEGWTVVVNPAGLADIRLLDQLPDPRPAR